MYVYGLLLLTLDIWVQDGSTCVISVNVVVKYIQCLQQGLCWGIKVIY